MERHNNLLTREYGRFAAGWMFLTRLPSLPYTYQPTLLANCHHYFPVIGMLLGGIVGGFYYILFPILGNDITVWLTLGFSVLLTGAFHEDGFADTCDGLGGGWTKEKKLEIMKDSRLGTYGTIGLVLILGLKFLLLTSFDRGIGLSAILVAYILSRTVIVPLTFTLDYAGKEMLDKPLAGKTSLAIAILTSAIGWILITFLLGTQPFLWFASMTCFIGLIFLSHYFLKSQIEGFTGDTLGAVNQIMEVLVYFIFTIFNCLHENGLIS